MSYANIMVHLEPGAPNDGLLRITEDVAKRFCARVSGIVACQLMQMVYGDGTMYADAVNEDRSEVEAMIEATSARFHAALGGKVAHLDWRSSFGFEAPAEVIANEARCADLLIIGVGPARSITNGRSRLDAGALLMRVGRPVLVVPANKDALDIENVVIGWRDTIETRRAVASALPMLKHAGHVSVVEMTTKAASDTTASHLRDVVRWLSSHGIVSREQVVLAEGDDAAQLERIAENCGAGLIVAGAYGHSRMTEWVLGGVTRDLLLQPRRCVFVSH